MLNYEILADGLVYYKNLIKNPSEIINDIEKLNDKVVLDIANSVPGSNSSKAKPWGVWEHDHGNGMVERFCRQRWLERREDIPLDDIYYNEYCSIADRLFSALDQSYEHYSTQLYPYAARNIKSTEKIMSILKYEKSGHLPEHSDHGSSSRTLSMVLYLNDDYDGGEITFTRVGVTIKPEAGSAIFFPSNFVFTHEVSEVTNGVRYALPNWYHNMKNKIDTDGTE